MYSTTYFGGPHVHHQELNNCKSSLWFYHWSVVVAVLLVVVGPVASGWLIHLKCMIMHGLANFNLQKLMSSSDIPSTQSVATSPLEECAD